MRRAPLQSKQDHSKVMNAVEIEEAVSALAERPFDSAEFPFQFLEAFGNKETTIKRLRAAQGSTKDRKSVVQGKSVSVRVDLGGRRIIQTKILTPLSHPPTHLLLCLTFLSLSPSFPLLLPSLSPPPLPLP